MNKTQFPCNTCGHCGRSVHLSAETNFLNRGDGICQFFDENTHLCKIYNNRPIVCRVEDYYDAYLTNFYTWDVFINMNIEICHKLQRDNNQVK